MNLVILFSTMEENMMFIKILAVSAVAAMVVVFGSDLGLSHYFQVLIVFGLGCIAGMIMMYEDVKKLRKLNAELSESIYKIAHRIGV